MGKQIKLTGAALEFFQKVGSKGGTVRAKKYSKRQLSKWAKLGGRPPDMTRNTQRVREIMKKRRCSRQWAYVLLRKEEGESKKRNKTSAGGNSFSPKTDSLRKD